jgi:uncharacterized protein (TIGR00255 family)
LIRSMTGFAEKRFESKTFSVKISIRSLNHRFFDWSFRGNHSKEMEERLRRICSNELQRGRIEVLVEVDFLDPEKLEVRVNEAVLKELLSSFGNISSRMKKNVNLNVENLFNLPYVVQIRRKKFSKNEIAYLEECFTKTLLDLIKGRTREGKLLKTEIIRHIRKLHHVVKQVEILSAKQPKKIQKRLSERLRELGHQASISEEKMAAEVAYYAQRYDLTEEIARLKCHVDHFIELLSSERRDPVGKNLDFLTQEMFREANTINSKAQDLGIVKQGLVMKGEVEIIRQQVQNLE